MDRLLIDSEQDREPTMHLTLLRWRSRRLRHHGLVLFGARFAVGSLTP
jgi:hypothetical protein